MSEYRRFVAYIYEYQKGQKKNNVGYVKADARSGVCRLQMNLQIPGAPKQELKIYGFVRRQGQNIGILLGEGVLQRGSLSFRVTTPEERFGNVQIAFGHVAGIWIRGENETDYISIWDEETVDTASFAEWDETKQQVQAQCVYQPEETPAECAIEVQPKAEEEMCPASDDDQRWRQFCYHYPHIQPFFEESIEECLVIAPKDISYLNRKEWVHCRNPFLQKAYRRYRHLILGRWEDGRYFLGVPGICRDEQDRQVAGMYGFPEFCPGDVSRVSLELPEIAEGDKFGYWYHFLTQ